VRLIIWIHSEQAVAAKGGDFLEAPVSGSKQPAESATLIILSAGKKVHTLTFTLYQILGFRTTYESRILRNLEFQNLAFSPLGSPVLQSLFDKVKPAFDAMGKKSFYLNEVGSGAKMKLVVNMIMGRCLSRSLTLLYHGFCVYGHLYSQAASQILRYAKFIGKASS
jgi:glyoxylate/succinic semialdehyde reductase